MPSLGEEAASLTLLPQPAATDQKPSRPPKPKAPPDPLRSRLSDALMAVGREERAGSFAFGGAKGHEALLRLLSWSRDVDEHVRRFRLALRSPAADYGFRVDTIAAFATDRVWNHFAPSAAPAPKIRPLVAPGA